MPFENERNRETTIEDAVRLHLSGGCLRQPPLVLPTPKRAAAAASAQTTPSAERSEARARCVRRRQTCRVASPPVMAAANAPNAFRLQAGRAACVRGRHYPCFAGDSATRHMLRLRRPALRLRCAPSSWARSDAPQAPKRAAAAASAQTTTSAERSEARARCVHRRQTCRVASPPVMAAANAPNAFRLQAGRIPCVRGRHYPCFAGDSATRHMLRLRCRALRLRCAPSSWAHSDAPQAPKRAAAAASAQTTPSAERSGAQRSASTLRTPSPNVPCGITSGDGGRERAKRLQTAGWARSLRARPPLPLLRRG
jgi:hypothetical protein